MKKFLCVLSVLSAVFALSTMCFAGAPSQGSASDEPVYYDGVNNKLGTSSNPFFFANGTPITISESGDGTVITWADGSVEVANNTNVFGGYHDDDTAVETSIVMNGGTVNAILGGGLHKSHVTKASVK